MDEKRGIVQITTADERWYVRESTNSETGLPEMRFVPSVTWIAGFYPKGIGFYKWLADKGWDEAEAIKSAAGDKGSKVHQTIVDLLDEINPQIKEEEKKRIKIDSQYLNPTTGQMEELTLGEWECIISFVQWFKESKPEVIHREIVIWNEDYGYAGTIDFVAKINNQLWIIDFKTGQNIWAEHELQISAYKHAYPTEEPVKLGLLQLGYQRNKNAYKFTEIEDKFNLFLATRSIWENATAGNKPLQKDFPLMLSLAEPEKPEEVKENKTKGKK